ncbi:MAG: glycosyltransferase [Holosporales bacterium]
MIKLSSNSICVIGRAKFGTGIGYHTYAVCELLSRFYSISIFPTEPHLRGKSQILLPNGTAIPVCTDLSQVKIAFFCDVLWNGAYDSNYLLVPQNSFKFAYVAFDSDTLPSQWIKILNERFDCTLFTSRHLEAIASKSGLEISAGTLPLALDIENLLSLPFQSNKAGKIKFCSVAAFHTRKGAELLVEAFLNVFDKRNDVELTIHSNHAEGQALQRVRDLLKARGAKNIFINRSSLSEREKNLIIENSDIFVNCSRGEGYSIGPREALALGKVLAITNVGGHNDLHPVPGVFVIPATIPVPARYPEIDNLVIGKQYMAEIKDIEKALRAAFDYVSSGQSKLTVHERRKLAQEFCFSRLEQDYAELINPGLRSFRPRKQGSRYTRRPPGLSLALEKKIGRYCSLMPGIDRKVIQPHDGGFFSIFNVFMSHLVWDQRDNHCHMVLPDWNVERMISRLGTKNFISFCYGRPNDGNIWTKIFKPLYGLTEQEMDDPDFLYSKGQTPLAVFNEDREPQLTYVHAYKLYKSEEFGRIREQYHKVFSDHVHLHEQYQDELNEFRSKYMAGKYVIAAHVKHPSHVIEQPGGKIAHVASYISNVRSQLAARGIDEASSNWAVFLATDQDRVVKAFEAEFGSKVIYYPDVRRTTEDEDNAYDQLDSDARRAEGFQVQHRVAANPDNWGVRMAWEVIRDALTMSYCDVLLHVVSNVSTAVSYMNPKIEMVFCEGDATLR